MSDFPDSIYDPRTKENKAGVIYEPEESTKLFSEDITYLDAEVVAIETALKNIIDNGELSIIDITSDGDSSLTYGFRVKNVNDVIGLEVQDNGDITGKTFQSNDFLNNIYIGAGCLGNVTTGNYNLAMGYNALNSLTTGYRNFALGRFALKDITDGERNIAIGYGAGQGSSSITYSIIMGHNVAVSTDLINSFILGAESGRYYGSSSQLTSLIYCIQLGNNIKSGSTGTATKEIIIGSNVVGNGSYTVTIGGGDNTDNYLNGNIHATGNVLVKGDMLKMTGITTTERDSLTPEAGDIIYNTTTNKHEAYNGSTWNNLY